MLLLLVQRLDAQSIDTLAMRAHTRFLAADVLEGRGTGTRGEHVAAAYIAAALMRIGAQPADGQSFFQPVPLKRAVVIDSATTVALNGTTFHSVRDFVWSTGGPKALHDFAGPLLYVGHVDTLAIRRAGEARGHVVVLAGALGGLGSEYMLALTRARAAGVVILAMDPPTYGLYVRARGAARYFTAAETDDPVRQSDLPIVIAGPRLGRAMVPDSALPRFTPLRGTIRATFRATIEDIESANVIGVMRGSDPSRASEYIAFSAHYDHLGIDEPDARGDSIYNGFSDNAAGVAMLLALGDHFRRQPPAHSVALLFFTGEERGLLGSTYFTTQPTLPLSRIRALINLDAGAPPAAPTQWRIAGGTASALGEVARVTLAARGWEAQLGAASPNSDHWPFLQRGVPSIFIIPGPVWEGVTPAQQAALQARWDRYHRADDEYSDDFPFLGLLRYAETALAVARAVDAGMATR